MLILMLAKNLVIWANICSDIDWYYDKVLDNIIRRHWPKLYTDFADIVH
jgi:hypothetical protein